MRSGIKHSLVNLFSYILVTFRDSYSRTAQVLKSSVL